MEKTDENLRTEFRVSEMLSITVEPAPATKYVVDVVVFEHRIDLSTGPFVGEVITGTINADGCVNWATTGEVFHFCVIDEMYDLAKCFEIALALAARIFDINSVDSLLSTVNKHEEWKPE